MRDPRPPEVSSTAFSSVRVSGACVCGMTRFFSVRPTAIANTMATTTITHRVVFCQFCIWCYGCRDSDSGPLAGRGRPSGRASRSSLQARPYMRVSPSRLGLPHVGEGELHECLTVILILLQGEGHVERGLMFGEVVVPLGGPPRDRPENPAVLPQGHL